MIFATDYVNGYAKLSPQDNHLRVAVDFLSGFEYCLVFTHKIPSLTAYAITRCVYERMMDASLYYHTPLHILTLFQFAQQNEIELEEWEKLAIWFHDVIYIPGYPLNEWYSAEFMKSMIAPFLDPSIIDNVWNGIIATSKHLLKSTGSELDPKFERLLDLDLCSFSWDKENYDASSDKITEEFLSLTGVSGWKEGRIKFLTDLLAKPSIYRTSFFKEKFEQKARANIEQTLKELKG